MGVSLSKSNHGKNKKQISFQIASCEKTFQFLYPKVGQGQQTSIEIVPRHRISSLICETWRNTLLCIYGFTVVATTINR